MVVSQACIGSRWAYP